MKPLSAKAPALGRAIFVLRPWPIPGCSCEGCTWIRQRDRESKEVRGCRERAPLPFR